MSRHTHSLVRIWKDQKRFSAVAVGTFYPIKSAKTGRCYTFMIKARTARLKMLITQISSTTGDMLVERSVEAVHLACLDCPSCGGVELQLQLLLMTTTHNNVTVGTIRAVSAKTRGGCSPGRHGFSQDFNKAMTVGCFFENNGEWNNDDVTTALLHRITEALNSV
jgi:hypothetical protein